MENSWALCKHLLSLGIVKIEMLYKIGVSDQNASSIPGRYLCRASERSELSTLIPQKEDQIIQVN